MDNKIKEICRKYGFASGNLREYKGGYPIIEFLYEEGFKDIKYNNRYIKRILRKAEIDAGIEIGVGLNFINTGEIKIKGNMIILHGHISVIEKVLEKLFNK